MATARAAVNAAFITVYGHGEEAGRLRYLQGADQAVAVGGEQAAVNPNYSAIAADETPVVTQVVFVDPTHAAVLYELDIQGRPVLGPKVGHALLDGGTWRVTRGTYCVDVDSGGGHC
jgi:hypothetical protein